MKRLYEKSRILFAVIWIVAYCVLMSVGDALSSAVGIQKVITLPIALVLSLLLFWFIWKNGLAIEYGFCKPRESLGRMLFYIPALLMMGVNLIFGVGIIMSAHETVLYILTMLCVGFLEEVIFRGLLFTAMRTESESAAIITSSLTFGIGHIINLVNGSGAELLPNLLQVVYAVAAGFMFVFIFIRTKSLIPCILIHGIFNSLSAFSTEASGADEHRIISAILLTVITGAYALYLFLTRRKEDYIQGKRP